MQLRSAWKRHRLSAVLNRRMRGRVGSIGSHVGGTHLDIRHGALQSATAQLFLQALQNRAKEIPNLISPHLGDRVPITWALASAASAAQPVPTTTRKRP